MVKFVEKTFRIMVYSGVIGFFVVKIFLDDSLQNIRFLFAALMILGIIGRRYVSYTKKKLRPFQGG